MSEEARSYGIAVMFHPSGVRVTLPLSTDFPVSEDIGRVMLQGVSNLLSAGFLAEMPGTNGDKFEVVTHVSRRVAGDETPIVAFYPENTMLVRKCLHKYLNTPEDVADFEGATGLKLSNIPLYEGEKDIDRDGSQKSNKYVVKLPRPMKLVYKISERWQEWKDAGGEGTAPQKNILLRYDAYSEKPSHTPTQSATARSEPLGSELPGSVTRFKKNSGDLVTAVCTEMHVKPPSVSPILYKFAPEYVSVNEAIELVKQHLKEEA